MKLGPLLAIIGGGLLVAGGFMSQPRGIRNNNPGNIRHGDKWIGMSANQTDPEFVQFETPEYGIRAMYRIFINYNEKHNLKTISDYIKRWAPPSENDTNAYILAVSNAMEKHPNYKLTWYDTPALIAAVIKQENGVQPYTQQQILKGMALA